MKLTVWHSKPPTVWFLKSTSTRRCQVLWCASTRRIPRSREAHFTSRIQKFQCLISAWGFYHLALLPKNFYLSCWRRCMFFHFCCVSSGPCWPHTKFHVTWSRKQRFQNDKLSFVLLCGRTTQELESSSHNNIFEMLQVSLHPCPKVFSLGSRILIKKNTVYRKKELLTFHRCFGKRLQTSYRCLKASVLGHLVLGAWTDGRARQVFAFACIWFDCQDTVQFALSSIMLMGTSGGAIW